METHETTVPQPDIRRGRPVLRQLLDTRWVHRRVERVEFLDDKTVRRHVSVDLTVPNDVVRMADGQGTLPLTLLSKRPLIGFDVRDASGRSLSVLTSAQNAELAFAALAAAAGAVLTQSGAAKKTLAAVVPDIYAVAFSSAVDAEAVIERWLERPTRITEALMDFENEEGVREFAVLLDDVARNFVLFPVLDAEPGQRLVVKFSYVEPFPGPQQPPDDTVGTSLRERLAARATRIDERIGWRADSFGIDVPGVGRGGSYHLEVRCPRGLTFVGGRANATHSGKDVSADVRFTTVRPCAFLGRPARRSRLRVRVLSPGALRVVAGRCARLGVHRGIALRAGTARLAPRSTGRGRQHAASGRSGTHLRVHIASRRKPHGVARAVLDQSPERLVELHGVSRCAFSRAPRGRRRDALGMVG